MAEYPNLSRQNIVSELLGNPVCMYQRTKREQRDRSHLSLILHHPGCHTIAPSDDFSLSCQSAPACQVYTALECVVHVLFPYPSNVIAM